LVAGIAWGARRSASVLGRGAVAMPASIAAAFLVQSQLDWTWSVPALTTVAMGAGGVLLAGAAGGSPGPRPARAAPRVRAGGALLGVATAGAVASALLPWWSGEQVASGEAALAAGRGRAAIARADEAHRLNPLAIAPL